MARTSQTRLVITAAGIYFILLLTTDINSTKKPNREVFRLDKVVSNNLSILMLIYGNLQDRVA